MKFFAKFILLVSLPSLALASGGYTFLGSLTHSLGLGNHVLTFIMVAGLILLGGFFYRSSVAKIPQQGLIPDKGVSFRNIVEAFGEFIYGLCKSTMGEKEAKKYFAVIGFLFIFIFLSNLIGLIPGFLPPTDNINTTLGLGLFVFLYYNYQGIREQGVVGHIKHFMGPVWYLAILIFPIELISHIVRPMSLALRLRGNMFGDHLVLSIFSDMIPYIVPIPFILLGLFVCFIQAFVFCLLTMVYISLATAHHDHDDAHAH
ncbi:MAG: F0F1 ATP synthase subunit A [Bacteriovoracaceae bacterium]|nr:F0F1 ATP synthase subunit A [Bacteriovoracaceae bacterium]